MPTTLKQTFWGKRIEKARKRGDRFTEGDRLRADSWVTCACGKQDKRIPRDPTNAPCDTQLYSLGIWFARNVGDDDVDAAEATLLKIERRAAEVLANVLANIERRKTKGKKQ